MNLNEPAMPLLGETNGLSLREYAAIHLCIPDSGNDELDAMIKRAQRERIAGKIISGLMHIPGALGVNEITIRETAFRWADAVIAAGGSNEAK